MADSKRSEHAENVASTGGPSVSSPLIHMTSTTRGATSGHPFSVRYEIPTEQPGLPPVLSQTPADDLSAGNHAFTLDAKENGRIGLFKDRSKVPRLPTVITLNPYTMHCAITRTISGFIEKCLITRGTLENPSIASRAENMAAILADGCMLMAYLKCRNLALSEFRPHHERIYLNRPRVIAEHMIPTAFAYAIQQLGIVHIADHVDGLAFMPQFPAEGHTCGLVARSWNPNAYYQVVDYCKELGMRFSAVDLKVKKGSAWWLLRPYLEEGIFELQLPFSEVNFTDSMAAAYCLFLPSNPASAIEPLFNLTAHTSLYGTLVREPHLGVNLSCFEAIAEIAPAVWSNV